MTKIFAWDTETNGLLGEAVYVSYAYDQVSFGEELHGPDDLTRWLIERVLRAPFNQYLIVAHYGTRFDMLRIRWQMLAEAGFTARFYTAKNPNDILGVDILKDGQCWRFRDSFRYFPASLAKLVETFAPDYQKGLLDFDKESFDPRNPAHVTYAVNDAHILRVAVERLNCFLEGEFSVTLDNAITASGIAFKALGKHAKAEGFRPPIPLVDELEPLVRHSYHGGLVGAWRTGTFEDVLMLDFNSMYGAIMLEHGIPSGVARITRSPYSGEIPALVLAKINMREAYPFVMSKSFKHGFGRWTGSELWTWAWDFELKLQEELGATVERLGWITWPDLDFRHRGFIARCRSLRRDRGGAVGALAKLFQNSCYGKYGSSAHEYDLILDANIPPNAQPLFSEDGEIIESLWTVPAHHRQKSMVHYASYITAAARVLLMRTLNRLPRENWLAGDTDSLIIPTGELSRFLDLLGPDYGQLKIETEGAVTISAPKTYKFELPDGTNRYRNKGIPRKLSETAWETGRAEYLASSSLGVIMKRQREDGVLEYGEMSERRLSGPGSVRQGYYDDGGYWQPRGVHDTVVPGLGLLRIKT